MSSGGLFGYRGLGLYERLSHLTASSPDNVEDHDDAHAQQPKQASDDAARQKGEVESREVCSTKIHLNFMGSGHLRKSQAEHAGDVATNRSRAEMLPVEAEASGAGKVTETKAEADAEEQKEERRGGDDEDQELKARRREEEAARMEARALAEEAIVAAEAAAQTARKAAENKATEKELGGDEEVEARHAAKDESHISAVRNSAHLERREGEGITAGQQRENPEARLLAEQPAIAAQTEAEVAREAVEATARDEEEVDARQVEGEKEAPELAAEAELAPSLVEDEKKEEYEEMRESWRREESRLLTEQAYVATETRAEGAGYVAEAKDRGDEELAARRTEDEEEEEEVPNLGTETEEARHIAEFKAEVEEKEREQADRRGEEDMKEVAQLATEAQEARRLAEVKTRAQEEELANREEEGAAEMQTQKEKRRAIAEQSLCGKAEISKDEEELGTRTNDEGREAARFTVEAEEARELAKVNGEEFVEEIAELQNQQAAQVFLELPVVAAEAGAASRLVEVNASEKTTRSGEDAEQEPSRVARLAEGAQRLAEVKDHEEEEALLEQRRHEEKIRLDAEQELVAAETGTDLTQIVVDAEASEGEKLIAERSEREADAQREVEAEPSSSADVKDMFEQLRQEQEMRSLAEQAIVVGAETAVESFIHLVDERSCEGEPPADWEVKAHLVEDALEDKLIMDEASDKGKECVRLVAEIKTTDEIHAAIFEEPNYMKVLHKHEGGTVATNAFATEAAWKIIGHDSEEALKNDVQEYNSDELEEAATKASSADEAKSSTASEDGIEANEEVLDEIEQQAFHALRTAAPEEGPMPTYFYIGDVNCKVRSEASWNQLDAAEPQLQEKLATNKPSLENSVEYPHERRDAQVKFCGEAEAAQWISPEYVSWSVANIAPRGSRFYLSGASTADGAVVRHELQVVQHSEHSSSQSGALLKLSEDVAAVAHQLCRQGASVCCEGAGAGAVKVAPVMIGGLLDEIFRFDGELGCRLAPTVDIGVEGFQFALWAPTALGVVLVLYDTVDGPISGEVPMVRDDDEKVRDDEKENDGVWRAWGPLMWRGKYYSYRVQVHCPVARQSRCIDMPDPYASVCHPGVARSLVSGAVPVFGTDDLADATQAKLKPMLVHRAKAAIFELSDTDLCALDTSCSSSSYRGHIDLRRLCDAGITHVHIRDAAFEETERSLQFKDLVAYLHAEGQRVVVDAPLSCTTAAHTFAKYIPAYCSLEHDVSMNRASQSQMVEQLVVNRCVHWAVDLQVDGFCLDPSQFTSNCIRSCRVALNKLNLEKHGVDGPRILLYTKGCLPQDTSGLGESEWRSSSYCSGISQSSSKICEAVECLFRTCESNMLEDSLTANRDLLCHGLAASLNEYLFHGRPYGKQPSFACPDEAVNCVSLLNCKWSQNCSEEEVFRLAWLGMGAVALAQGTPLFSFHDTSMLLDAFQNREAAHSTSLERMYEFMSIRTSTPLFSLTDPRDILEKVSFPSTREPGVVIMQTQNGPPARFSFAPPLCHRFARIVIVLSTRRVTVRVPAPAFANARAPLQLHPVQVESVDQCTIGSFFDAETDELVVPPLSVVVFVEPIVEEDLN